MNRAWSGHLGGLFFFRAIDACVPYALVVGSRGDPDAQLRKAAKAPSLTASLTMADSTKAAPTAPTPARASLVASADDDAVAQPSAPSAVSPLADLLKRQMRSREIARDVMAQRRRLRAHQLDHR